MIEQMDGQASLFDLDTWSGKTYPEHSAAKPERISRRSSKKSSKSANRMPVCVCVYRTEDGQRPDTITLRMEDGQSLGACMTHNSGACRRDESGLLLWPISTVFQRPRFYLTFNCTEKPYTPIFSRLSEILQSDADEKYNLSARACQGILNRAERRGKELPPELKAALIAQSQSTTKPQDTGAVEPDGMMTEEATALALESDSHLPQSPRASGMEFSVSKNEPVNLGGGARESSFSMNTPEPCQPSIIKASAFKAGNGAKAGNIGYEEELSPTLSAEESGTNQVPTCFAVDCRNATENSNVNGTLQAKSGGGISLNCNNVIRTSNNS